VVLGSQKSCFEKFQLGWKQARWVARNLVMNGSCAIPHLCVATAFDFHMSSHRANPPSNEPDLPTRLRAWRRVAGLNQSQLEARAGLSHNAVSRIEQAQVSPRLETIEAIASALEISVEELQFGQIPETLDPESNGSEVLRELEGMLLKLPPDKRWKAMAILRQIVEVMEA
jgi:transcriptional regulator with XRE-family HTH domain